MAGILPPLSAYSFRHLHSPPLHAAFQQRFLAVGTLSYHDTPPKRGTIRGFGGGLQSRPFSAQIHSTGELLRTL